MPTFFRKILKPFGFLSKLFRKLPTVERETLLSKCTQWSRTLSFLFLAACPLLLIYQLSVWVEVRFWFDVSIGSLIFPDSETAKVFNHGTMRILMDTLWIPLWFESLTLALILFATHMILWNRMDTKRQARRRARRTTTGSDSGKRRRHSP